MAHIGTGVEYALHCLLWLVDSGDQRSSSRDLAQMLGISPTYVARIFSRLSKAGIVESSEGIGGGCALLAAGMARKGMPPGFNQEARHWFANRQAERERTRLNALQDRPAGRKPGRTVS
jgi:DNA-binding transcriptional MocR family regulator